MCRVRFEARYPGSVAGQGTVRVFIEMPARPVMEDLVCLYQLLPPELAETEKYAWLLDQCFDIVQMTWGRDEEGIYLDVMLEELTETDIESIAQYRAAAASPE